MYCIKQARAQLWNREYTQGKLNGSHFSCWSHTWIYRFFTKLIIKYSQNYKNISVSELFSQTLTWSSSFFSSSEHPGTENESLCKAKIHLTHGTTFDAGFDQQYCPTFPLHWQKSEDCCQGSHQRQNSSSRDNINTQLKQWKQNDFSFWNSWSNF